MLLEEIKLPPDWYKSLNYRARAVVDPRGVLKEFGLELAPDVEVRIYDSSADMRYLVIPERPSGTEHMSEAVDTAPGRSEQRLRFVVGDLPRAAVADEHDVVATAGSGA